MNESKLRYLYQQYIDGTGTEAEIEEFRSILKQASSDDVIKELLEQTWLELNIHEATDMDADKASVLYQSIVEQPQHKHNFFNKYWIQIAASIILIAGLGIYLTGFYLKKPILAVAKNPEKVEDIMPGSNKAILTLGNGKRIILDDSGNGQVAIQTDVVINKLKDGQLVYSVESENDHSATVLFNKIATPRGGQYKLVLPDGTKVYLNAESSLEYPTKFIGKERNVSLTGEAYFEVAKNAKMPFKVNVNNKQQVEVLGTHFNITAYEDENTINTTLIEGSVKVHNQTTQVLLKPGQQVIHNLSNSNLQVSEANIDEAMAWKNGYFVFNNENIKPIMQKLARWYNIDVSFNGNINNINFLGNYSYSKSLGNLLKSIELTNKVHFNIEGRRVIVIAN